MSGRVAQRRDARPPIWSNLFRLIPVRRPAVQSSRRVRKVKGVKADSADLLAYPDDLVFLSCEAACRILLGHLQRVLTHLIEVESKNRIA